MTDTIAAYWGPRDDTPAGAATKAARFLETLDALAGSSWFEKGSASPRPEDAVTSSHEGLADLFAKGVNRRDMDKSAIDELGYRISLWSGNSHEPVEISVQCGVTSTAPGVSNSVVLKVPSTASWRAAGEGVFEALVTAFEPDRAIWMTQDYRRTQPKVDGVTMFGWRTYVADSIASRLGELPAGVTSSPVYAGTVLTAGTEPGADSAGLAAKLAGRLA